MRGQGYDGASNMSSDRIGVQARIRQAVPLATCTSIVVDTVWILSSASLTPYQTSVMWWISLNTAVGSSWTVQNEVESWSWLSLRMFQIHLGGSLSWTSAKPTGLNTSVPISISTKHTLSSSKPLSSLDTTVIWTSMEISMLTGTLETAQRPSRYWFWSHRLSSLCPSLTCTNTSLIYYGCPRVDCRGHCDIWRWAERCGDQFQATNQQSVRMAERVGTIPEMPRVTGHQQYHSNPSSFSAEDYFKKTVAIPLLDHIITSMKDHFSAAAIMASSLLGVIPSVCCAREVDLERAIDKYKDDLPSPELTSTELRRWKARYSGMPVDLWLSTPVAAIKPIWESFCKLPAHCQWRVVNVNGVLAHFEDCTIIWEPQWERAVFPALLSSIFIMIWMWT